MYYVHANLYIRTDVQTVQNFHDSLFLPKSAALLQYAVDLHDHNMHLYKPIWWLLGVFRIHEFINVILYITNPYMRLYARIIAISVCI